VPEVIVTPSLNEVTPNDTFVAVSIVAAVWSTTL